MIASLRALLVAALCMATAMLPAQASANDNQMISYTVKQGDTLFGLSDKYFVGRSAVAKVARLNNISDPNRIGELLVAQVTGAVRWRESVLAMATLGVTEIWEVGAGKALSGMVRRIDRNIATRAVGTPDDVLAAAQR